MNILIIGTGNIGKRHCESFLISKKIKKIFLYDKNIKNLCESYNFLSKINFNKIDLIKVKNFESLSKFDINFFIAVISTSASFRTSIFDKLYSEINVRYWILEKPICNSIKDLKILKKYIKTNNIWINYQRRYQPTYKKLKLLIHKNTNPLYLKVFAKDIGLACNAYHWIDLIRWITGEIPLKFIDSNFRNWFSSKRRGYYEIDGSFVLYFSKGSILELSNNKIINHKTIIGNTNNKINFFINEMNNIFLFNNKKIYSKKLKQSEMTIKVFNDLIKYKNCNLETLSNSIKDHEIFFHEIIYNWNKFKFKNKFSNKKTLPIT